LHGGCNIFSIHSNSILLHKKKKFSFLFWLLTEAWEERVSLQLAARAQQVRIYPNVG
jgi:hypothetical protein